MSQHLGGYVVGGDEATWFPELWAWLVESMDVSSVLDVGCGDGQAVHEFARLGCTVQGIDGVPQDDPLIVEHDFTQGPYLPDRVFDMIWCCEFVEHIEER